MFIISLWNKERREDPLLEKKTKSAILSIGRPNFQLIAKKVKRMRKKVCVKEIMLTLYGEVI